ncbi:MAG: deoxyribose-phosphate aldolase [Candidatus Kapaibacterium sp.]
MTMDAPRLASTIDHTLLQPAYSDEQLVRLCAEARQWRFAAVCVFPSAVARANVLLEDSGIALCTVVGFPFGATYGLVKAHEAREAIARGASEIDMVIDIAAMKAARADDVLTDIKEVVEVSYSLGAATKVIIETALLTDDEKKLACELVTRAEADFIKTSTGFASHGATADDVRLLREHCGPNVRIKASGGIRTLYAALAMLDAGADRLGMSAGVSVMNEWNAREASA